MHKSFMTEASLAGKLNHPHIVDIYDAVIEAERSYLVMEYVPGVTLEAHSGVDNLLPVGKVVEIIFKCIRALEYAHNHGIIHRDIKPGNILVTAGGQVKLLDFGIAKLLNPGMGGMSVPHTRTAFRVMTPDYASPEQVRGEALTTATDVYSLGAILYELVTGVRPHRLDTYTPQEIERAVCESDPPRPSAAARQIGRSAARHFRTGICG
jgi:serine/threonine-protein kinase